MCRIGKSGLKSHAHVGDALLRRAHSDDAPQLRALAGATRVSGAELLTPRKPVGRSHMTRCRNPLDTMPEVSNPR